MKKQRFELSHDIIAEKIWARLPEQDKLLRQITRSVAQRQADYEAGSGSLLGKAELDAWKLYLPLLSLSTEQNAYINESQKKLAAVQQAELDRIQKEKAQIARNRLLQKIVAFVLVIASMVSGYFYWDADKTRSNAAAERTRLENEKKEANEKIAQANIDLKNIKAEEKIASSKLEEADIILEKTQNKARLSDSLWRAKDSLNQIADFKLKATQDELDNMEEQLGDLLDTLKFAKIDLEKAQNRTNKAIQDADDKAEFAKKLSKKELARSLALRANQIDLEKPILKAQLALEAQRLYEEADYDNAIYPEVFKALYNAFITIDSSAQNRSNYLLLESGLKIQDIVFSPDDKAIFTTNTRGWIEKRSIISEGELTKKPDLSPKTKYNQIPEYIHNALAVSPDGTKLAVAGRYRSIQLQDLNSNSAIPKYSKHLDFDEIYQLAFLTNDQLVFTGSDGAAYIWDSSTDNLKKLPLPSTAIIQGLAVLEQFIFLGNNNGIIYCWDINKKRYEILDNPGEAKKTITAMSASRNATSEQIYLAVGYQSGAIKLMKSNGNKKVLDFTILPDFDHHSTIISDLAFSKDGNQLAASSYDKSISIIDPIANTQLPKVVISDFEANVLSIAFLNEDQQLVAGSADMLKFFSLDIESYSQAICAKMGKSAESEEIKKELEKYYEIKHSVKICNN